MTLADVAAALSTSPDASASSGYKAETVATYLTSVKANPTAMTEADFTSSLHLLASGQKISSPKLQAELAMNLSMIAIATAVVRDKARLIDTTAVGLTDAFVPDDGSIARYQVDKAAKCNAPVSGYMIGNAVVGDSDWIPAVCDYKITPGTDGTTASRSVRGLPPFGSFSYTQDAKDLANFYDKQSAYHQKQRMADDPLNIINLAQDFSSVYARRALANGASSTSASGAATD